MRVADAAPEADRHMRVADRVIGEIVRHVVDHIVQETFLELGVGAVSEREWRERTENRIAAQAHVPGGRQPVGIETCGHACHCDGTIEVVPHVLFARP